MREYSDEEPINLGGGPTFSIRELAEAVRRAAGFEGLLEFDVSKPDGMPIKCLDTTRLAGMGYQPRVAFDDALAITCQWYLDHPSIPQVAHPQSGETARPEPRMSQPLGNRNFTKRVHEDIQPPLCHCLPIAGRGLSSSRKPCFGSGREVPDRRP